ncbi:hypothetical protein PIB30_070723 [Stylosanthes scabra]|uniref:Uncharacterized protein n=1 Tax=Stylosanthes scabra TaxID=79078 RepID=A0ABU6UMG6_9FABA|nr:hypothetical protein [Stylosanthes scabra]
MHIHQRQKIEREERSKRRREEKAKKGKEPTLAIQFDHLVKKKVQSKKVPSKKKKIGSQAGVTNPVQPQKDIPVQAAADSEPPKKKAETSAIESDTNLVQPHMAIQATIMPEHGSETEPPNKKTKTTTKEVDINPEHPRLDIPVQTSTIHEPEAEPEQAI